MSEDFRTVIRDLRDDQLVRVAQALYDPTAVCDAEQFEANPPRLSEVIEAVGQVVGADTASLMELAEGQLARKVLLEAAERDEHVRELAERARVETMSGMTDVALLIGLITYSLSKLV